MLLVFQGRVSKTTKKYKKKTCICFFFRPGNRAPCLNYGSTWIQRWTPGSGTHQHSIAEWQMCWGSTFQELLVGGCSVGWACWWVFFDKAGYLVAVGGWHLVGDLVVHPKNHEGPLFICGGGPNTSNKETLPKVNPFLTLLQLPIHWNNAGGLPWHHPTSLSPASRKGPRT